MKKYLLNKHGGSPIATLFIIFMVSVLFYKSFVVFSYADNLKKCKLIKITDPQTEETIEFYGTHVKFDHSNTINYRDNDGNQSIFNLSSKENSIVQIKTADDEFCK